MNQNKDREEFYKISKAERIIHDPMYGEENKRHLEEIWSWIQSYTKKKVEEAYKKGIFDVEKNIEYNAQTKVWEIPEEKLLSIQSKE